MLIATIFQNNVNGQKQDGPTIEAVASSWRMLVTLLTLNNR